MNTEYTYEKEIDYIENIYKDTETLMDHDQIEDWEEGFMQGYAQA
ncbi:MAG: hypothetical protein ACMXYD_01910 [Candidatus Woesearchaeota archaeon]